MSDFLVNLVRRAAGMPSVLRPAVPRAEAAGPATTLMEPAPLAVAPPAIQRGIDAVAAPLAATVPAAPQPRATPALPVAATRVPAPQPAAPAAVTIQMPGPPAPVLDARPATPATPSAIVPPPRIERAGPPDTKAVEASAATAEPTAVTPVRRPVLETRAPAPAISDLSVHDRDSTPRTPATGAPPLRPHLAIVDAPPDVRVVDPPPQPMDNDGAVAAAIHPALTDHSPIGRASATPRSDAAASTTMRPANGRSTAGPLRGPEIAAPDDEAPAIEISIGAIELKGPPAAAPQPRAPERTFDRYLHIRRYAGYGRPR